MPASQPDGMRSQFDAPQFHPEFGYFAPTMRFRRKVALTLFGVVWGLLIGAGAMFFAVLEREEKAVAMLATPVLTTPMTSAPATAPAAVAPEAPTAASPPPASSPPPSPTPARSTAARTAPASSDPASGPAARAPNRTAATDVVGPVPFVPQSIALPMAAHRDPPAESVTVPAVVTPPPATASEPSAT